MITGGRITSVEAKRDKDGPSKGLSINITVDNVKAEGENVDVAYTYSVDYTGGVGSLMMKGNLYSSEKNASEIVKMWEKDKKLPDEFAEVVLNAVNYVCGTNGTLVSTPLNLSPPMAPPRINLGKGGLGPAPSAKR
ncbi:MAG: hypothetical protein NT157_03565 [Candidatus Micrarchaeota archaeon]|nr:hypothetical protein [Candidatus Micrarchaeota archaeon]